MGSSAPTAPEIDLPEVPGGKIESTSGSVSIEPNKRVSMLSQDHFAFDEVPALTAVIMGHKGPGRVMVEKDALYAKPDFSEADGVRAGELEAAFADLNGWKRRSRRCQAAERGWGCTRQDTHRSDGPARHREGPRPHGPGALRQSGHPPPGRADQPPGRRFDPLAGEFLLDFPNTVVVVSTTGTSSTKSVPTSPTSTSAR